MIVLDASAAVELLLGSPRGRRVADRVAADQNGTWCRPTSSTWGACRRSHLWPRQCHADAGAAAARLLRLPAVRLSHLALAAAWGWRDRVRLADAVATAELVQAPLLTCDRRLAAAPLPGVDVA